MNPLLTKNYEADGAISPCRILVLADADDEMSQAAGATELLVAISEALTGIADGERVDCIMAGLADVEYGGTVTRGQPLTADVDGKAVAASRAVIEQTIIAGGSAGAHTVTGIETTDDLLAVIEIDGTDASETYADLTSEFSISADDEIDNTGGTDTTGSGLVVLYRKAGTRIIGFATLSGVDGDIGKALIAPGVI